MKLTAQKKSKPRGEIGAGLTGGLEKVSRRLGALKKVERINEAMRARTGKLKGEKVRRTWRSVRKVRPRRRRETRETIMMRKCLGNS